MKAKVTKEFKGRQPGDARVRTIKVGEVIEGDLAASMVSAGHAKPLSAGADSEKKPAAKAKTERRDKAKRAAPRNKATS